MNDLNKSKNYAVAKGPVNRRTAAATPTPKPPMARSVLKRVSMAQAKRRLGAPLSQRVAASEKANRQGALPSTMVILQAVCGTVCAIGLGLGVIQSSALVMGSSALLLGGVATWAGLTRRSAPKVHRLTTESATSDVADADALTTLDAVMETMATQAPQETIDSLTELKESIVRCMALLTSTQAEAGFASEESLYLREVIRRYIPDSIHGCLQVPQKDRANMVIDGGKSALNLLQDQLQMIQYQLNVREAKLTQFAAEALLRQQHFLTAKKSGQV